MALHRNLWSPDTCDCQIEFEFDDEVPAEERVHTGKKIVKRCDAHQETDFVDCHDHYKSVLDENQRKNILLGKLMETHPEIVNVKEDGSRHLKPEVDYIHHFTGKGKKRVLNVELVNLSTNTTPTLLSNNNKKYKDSINKIAKKEFGNGKVVAK